MMNRKSTSPPSADDIKRFEAIKNHGCIIARMRGQGFLECEVHHLTITAGTMRRGHPYTIGLNLWSHKGEPVNGWVADKCYELLGPSLKLHGREFKSTFGGDVSLLKYQNDLLGAPMPEPTKRVSRERKNKTNHVNGKSASRPTKVLPRAWKCEAAGCGQVNAAWADQCGRCESRRQT